MFSKYRYGFVFGLVCFFVLPGLSSAQQLPADSLSTRSGVVHVGFGTQNERQVTGAISAVSGNELRKTFAPNLANTLYGRIPGLMVVQSGNEPGDDSPTLYGRGLNTFGGAGSTPLVIVDGVESSFEQLSAFEIESISLLKDASATAIFGSRGANGILLVTTRRGSEGPLKINFNAQVGFQKATRLPEFVNSYDYARLFNEGLVNDGGQPFYTDVELEKYRTGSDPYIYPSVNWYEEVMRSTAPIANYNMNFTGGDRRVRYFASLNALTNGGLYKKTGDLSENSINAKYQRYNVRTNVDISLSDAVTAIVGLGGSVEEKSTPYANTTAPLFSVINTMPPNLFPVYNPDGSYGGDASFTNPLGDVLESGFFTSSGRTLQSSFRMKMDLGTVVPGLSVTPGMAYHTSFVSNSNKTREYERFYVTRDVNDEYVYTKYGQNTQLAGDEGNSEQWQNFTFQTFVNYEKQIGDYSLDAMAMYTYRDFTLIGSSPYFPTDGSVFSFQHLGGGARFVNGWKNKYFAELTVAYHGSENFEKGNRFGVFPALGLGWVVSDEEFFPWATSVDFLKLRGSFGIVGNDNVGGERFMFERSFRGSSGYYFGNPNTYYAGIEPGRLPNPGFTWEKEQKINIGFDATIGGRFDVKVDYFNQKRYDILVPAYAEIPQFVGLLVPYLNVGEASNQGVDAAITYTGRADKPFKYSVTANVWYADNKIVYNAERPQPEPYMHLTGRQINQPYVLEAIGFFKDQSDIDNSPRQVFAEVQPGDLKYKDQNNDGVVDNMDFVPVGNTNVPRVNLGLSSHMSYKGFYLDFLLQAVTGRTVYLSGPYYQAFQDNGTATKMAFGRWHDGNKENATYPRLSASNNLNNFQSSTFWQRDGSFLKVRNIEFGYRLPSYLSDKLGVNQVQVFVNGTNVFSLDHLEYSDPETLSGYPALRTISVGTSIEF